MLNKYHALTIEICFFEIYLGFVRRRPIRLWRNACNLEFNPEFPKRLLPSPSGYGRQVVAKGIRVAPRNDRIRNPIAACRREL